MFKNLGFLMSLGAILLGACLVLSQSAYAQAPEKGAKSWAVLYHSGTPITDLFNIDLLVLDPKSGYDVRTLTNRGQTVLAYLSIGEVENYRSYFARVKGAGAVLMENENWPGSYFVDIRKKMWARLLIEEVIPDLLRQGFNGLMLDTIDNPIYLATQGAKYKGMDKAAIRLVKAIRHHYPDIHIMLNRGFEILPDVAKSLDSVLAESTFTTYNFANKKAEKLTPVQRDYYFTALEKATKENKGLQVYSLDYWDPEDLITIRSIYHFQRAYGHVPYVSTIELNKVFKHEAGE